MSEKFTYCPICQLPLRAITISPDAHVAMCMTRYDGVELEECPKGLHCLSTDVFHYRDFCHKLLAAYRSSSDFIPPDVEIKPSPKKRKTQVKLSNRSSPRKKKTPTKLDQKYIDSDSESDSEGLIQTKKPRRDLKLNENRISQTSVNHNTLKSTSKRALKSASNKLTTNPSHKSTTKNAKKKNTSHNKGLESQVQTSVSKPSLNKSTIVNVSLNSGDELRFTKSRSIASLSSLSVSTTVTSNAESDLESETTSGSAKKMPVNSPTKVVLKEPVLTLENLKSHDIRFEAHCKPDVENKSDTKMSMQDVVEVDKEPVLCLERLNSHDKKFEPQSKSAVVENKSVTKISIPEKVDLFDTETNKSLCMTDFDDIIPGSMLDKELLKTIENRLDSPATTVHTCSEYNVPVNSPLSVAENETSVDENDSLDPPSSPEVIIPSRPRKSSTALLTSSSDSDLPLSKLITRKPKTVLNKMTEVKGKVKAGKVLRTPNKSPAYFNGSSLLNLNGVRTEVGPASDKDSDSGKSSTCADASFVPSEKSSTSSQHSDSAFSAQSTDNLTASSASSTYTSSESYSESRSSDPSYSEESDITHGLETNKSKKNQKYERKTVLTPRKKHIVKSLSSLSEDNDTASVSSSTSSSEISMREKLLFTTKKSSPKNTPLKSNKSPLKIKKSFKASTLGLLDTTDSDDKSEWQSLLNKMRSGCFPSDLKIDSEDSLTVVSSCSGSDTSYTSSMLPPRQCPFYKRIPDTPFVVDAFQYWNIPGVKMYFLSHFHSDHYIGLKKSFAHPIYCTRITANLVRMKLRVEEKWLRVVELNEPQIICGVEVTALEANHCPGSVMFLFSLTNGQNHLHVGDFRACKAMTLYPSLKTIPITKLFLDTTYCSPQYCFPTQEEVISKVVEIVRKHVTNHPRTLVVCGSYTIGKEKVFLGIAEALDWRVWARPEKQRVFACINDPRINARLVKDCHSANVHVLPMASIQMRCLQQHLESCMGAFTHIIGVKPTGWELDTKSNQFKVTSRDNITIYGVPYSEHSSFTELRDFVQFLQPHEIVPTVNMGSAASRGKMSKHFSEWLRPTSQSTEKQTKVSQYFKTCS